ncbi:SSU ribosomal protein S12P methylthiotransferase [Roseovarius marisflavi]|uniref:Ribosomal protein uS12 methylthiotransferase RimO n=2 Tax=Roseovarius marisflavi TaxID=1054996 RepID=A0A1M7CAW4_9RHOB|nr:SSU ribosomal protein S12P methylthiotransferase [Roseovarius marisflavi]
MPSLHSSRKSCSSKDHSRSPFTSSINGLYIAPPKHTHPDYAQPGVVTQSSSQIPFTLARTSGMTRAMSQNPPSLRPDLAPRAKLTDTPRKGQPTIGMVSLGCPKALVDSERILTRLRAEGYGISPDYTGADAVIVNTCGFLDSAKAESLDAIGEALAENGRVIVTGCLGAEPDYIREHHPRILAVTGPHQYEQVLDAVHAAVPPSPDPFIDLLPASGVSLTPRHYSYLKISEGCNHKCKFCIIPDMRGRLASRPAHAVLREAEKLVENGVKELLVISQDTSAYGVDIKHAEANGHRAHITDLARDLGALGAWVRLHYVYPYPHVRNLIPLMAEGLVLPYLDIPFQHAHPETLRRMARPAAAARTLDEIAAWRSVCPDLTLRSTFIVGYPGETEAEFQTLLDWLDEAQLDRVGCFQYENVAGARSNDLPDHVADEIKQDRWDRFMEKAQGISEAKLAAKVGQRIDVIIDDIDSDGIATCRTKADAPEIDGNLFIDEGTDGLSVGDIVSVEVDEAGEYDLWASLTRT